MGTFANRRGHAIKTVQFEDGRWFTPCVNPVLFLDVEYFENRTEIWVVMHNGVGKELKRWNAAFLRSIVWEN